MSDKIIAEETVYLLSIYDKSDKEILTNKELEELLESIPEKNLLSDKQTQLSRINLWPQDWVKHLVVFCEESNLYKL